MRNILVSACLLGENVRYNAEVVPVNDAIAELTDRYNVIPVCPEVLGGLSVPREACEIIGADGIDVINGKASVSGNKGTDYTDAFIIGAKKVLELAREHNAEFAVLKERSPSCGSTTIYTGDFNGTTKAGEGVCAALLKSYNIKVISENDI